MELALRHRTLGTALVVCLAVVACASATDSPQQSAGDSSPEFATNLTAFYETAPTGEQIVCIRYTDEFSEIDEEPPTDGTNLGEISSRDALTYEFVDNNPGRYEDRWFLEVPNDAIEGMFGDTEPVIYALGGEIQELQTDDFVAGLGTTGPKPDTAYVYQYDAAIAAAELLAPGSDYLIRFAGESELDKSDWPTPDPLQQPTAVPESTVDPSATLPPPALTGRTIAFDEEAFVRAPGSDTWVPLDGCGGSRLYGMVGLIEDGMTEPARARVSDATLTQLSDLVLALDGYPGVADRSLLATDEIRTELADFADTIDPFTGMPKASED